MSKSYFDMNPFRADDYGPTLPVSAKDLLTDKRFVDLDSYAIYGWNDSGVGYVYKVSRNGVSLTYHKPKGWTDVEWDEFCDEMEEPLPDNHPNMDGSYTYYERFVWDGKRPNGPDASTE